MKEHRCTWAGTSLLPWTQRSPHVYIYFHLRPLYSWRYIRPYGGDDITYVGLIRTCFGPWKKEEAVLALALGDQYGPVQQIDAPVLRYGAIPYLVQKRIPVWLNIYRDLSYYDRQRI